MLKQLYIHGDMPSCKRLFLATSIDEMCRQRLITVEVLNLVRPSWCKGACCSIPRLNLHTALPGM